MGVATTWRVSRPVDSQDNRPGYDAYLDLAPLAADWPNFINATVLVSLWSTGFMHPQPELWFWVAARLVLKTLGLHFSTAIAFQAVAKATGHRIQTEPTAPPEHVWPEIVQTVIGFAAVVAPLLAWSAVRAELGQPTSLVWSVQECLPSWMAGWPLVLKLGLYLVGTLIGLLFADAYNYWKHRAFHHPVLWPWHRYHHAHRNPSALTGYAISPMYGLATFWPLVLFATPAFPMYGPFQIAVVGFYLLLNHYLHCGYVVTALENVLAPCFIMTSAWHNTHHNRGRRGFNEKDQTFSEMLTLWDMWMGTYPEACKFKGKAS